MNDSRAEFVEKRPEPDNRAYLSVVIHPQVHYPGTKGLEGGTPVAVALQIGNCNPVTCGQLVAGQLQQMVFCATATDGSDDVENVVHGCCCAIGHNYVSTRPEALSAPVILAVAAAIPISTQNR